MSINLTPLDIERALPRLAGPLERYSWLQANINGADLHFRRMFNGLYRVRRSREWQDNYFCLLDRLRGKKTSFRFVVEDLYRTTHRVEASFASKMVATLEPDMPVIDSVVLRHVGLRLPDAWAKDRVGELDVLYARVGEMLLAYLRTTRGRYLVNRFREAYPYASITNVKMLDFVLWQAR